MRQDPVGRGAANAASPPTDFKPHTETFQKDPVYYGLPGKAHAGEVTKKSSSNGNAGVSPPVYSGQRIGGAKDFTQGGSGDGDGDSGNSSGSGGGGCGPSSGGGYAGSSGVEPSQTGQHNHPYRFKHYAGCRGSWQFR